MRIAGDTIRRNYLRRYERNNKDVFDSEMKIDSGRRFERASENPIDAARALRLRKSISEVKTYQTNLKTADSIYTNAESALMSVSGIIQTVYEKLVEGAHGTRNLNDLEIIAKEIDNHAEEMVQSLNIDVADRKIFGGLNNESAAFKIEGSGDSKYVTYNGVAVNSSSDINAFPYSGESYLDIGIGMSTNQKTGRIDDQSALPITFSGVECTGCGMTKRSAAIDLTSILNGNNYVMSISVGGRNREVQFQGGTTDADKVSKINEALKEAFQETAELDPSGEFNYIDYTDIQPYRNCPITTTSNGTTLIDYDAVSNSVPSGKTGSDFYYSLKVTMNGMTKYVDFRGGDTANDSMHNLRASLEESFGKNTFRVNSDGTITDQSGSKYAQIENASTFGDIDIIEHPLDTGKDKIDTSTLVNDGNTYAVNINGKRVVMSVGDTLDETIEQTNKAIAQSGIFGTPNVPYMTETGTLVSPDKDQMIVIDNANPNEAQFSYSSIDGYANNIIQLVLDSAKLLREGNQDMVARYADLIYAAQSHLSIAIADLGTNSKFIEFNEDRLAEVEINLDTKQNDIEATDLPSEITNWKVLQSIYNASLQMGSSFLQQSIFNYIN